MFDDYEETSFGVPEGDNPFWEAYRQSINDYVPPPSVQYDIGVTPNCRCQLVPSFKKEPGILGKIYNGIISAAQRFVEFEHQLSQVQCLTARNRKEIKRVVKKYAKDFAISKKQARDEIEYQLYMVWIK